MTYDNPAVGYIESHGGCIICGAIPMTANCNNAGCDKPSGRLVTGVELPRGAGDPDWFGYPQETDGLKITKDYEAFARGFNYPFDQQIDYDPRFDEDQEACND